MTTPTTFIFDCFGVICAPVLNGWYSEYTSHGGPVDPDIQNVFRQFDLGILSEDDIVEHFLKYKGITLSKEELRAQLDSYIRLNGALVQTIKKLRQKGFKTALLSNANNSFFERKMYPTFPKFKELFDEIVISSTIGMVKPDADIFLYTLEKLGSPAESCLFIDDSKTNVDAAITLGMQGFTYTDTGSFDAFITGLGIDLHA